MPDMSVVYRQFRETDTEVVTALIYQLHTEDPEGKPMSATKIAQTLEFLPSHPDQGKIMVLEKEGEVIGYALLINFWSNEYGGNILTVDELYIKPEYRGQKTGTNFITYLAETNHGNSVAMQLETTPENLKAKQLYKRLGFKLHPNTVMTKDLD